MLYYQITAHKGFIKNLNLIQHTLFHIYTDEHKIIQRTKKKIYDNHQVKKNIYTYIQAPMPTHTLQLIFKMMVRICRLLIT